MSIIRGPRPESGWYALDKRISEDERLSWAARGLLVFLLGKPDHWEVSIEHLRQQTVGARIKTGRDALYGLIGELESAGYLEREQANEAGRFGPTRYIVREIPAQVYREQAALPLPENPDTVGPRPAAPCTDQPYTGEPCTANPPLVKTDISAKTESKQRRTPKARALTQPIPLPDWVPADAWSGWLEMRDKQRKSPTDRAQGLALAELKRLVDAGGDARKIIERSTKNNWLDFYAIRGDGNGTNYGGHRRESVAERVERVNRELDEFERARGAGAV
jgi:hypothetical protein